MRAQLILIIQCLIRFCFRSCPRCSFLIPSWKLTINFKVDNNCKGMTAQYSSGVFGNVFIPFDIE